jgi:hypothetical protein
MEFHDVCTPSLRQAVAYRLWENGCIIFQGVGPRIAMAGSARPSISEGAGFRRYGRAEIFEPCRGVVISLLDQILEVRLVRWQVRSQYEDIRYAY